jgi:phosphoenolpyruvate synthase/pyruvate phosphate dikinase
MEGGSRTVALGAEPSDVDDATKTTLGVLALVGRLLQAHFSDGGADLPVDVEWLVDGDTVVLLQCRPYQLAA